MTNAPAPSVTQAAVEQVQRRRLHRRREHVVDGDRVAVAGARVHRRPLGGCSTAIWASCSDVVPYCGHVPARRPARRTPSASAARTASPTRASGSVRAHRAERRRRRAEAAIAAGASTRTRRPRPRTARRDRGRRVLDVHLEARAAGDGAVDERAGGCRGTRRCPSTMPVQQTPSTSSRVRPASSSASRIIAASSARPAGLELAGGRCGVGRRRRSPAAPLSDRPIGRPSLPWKNGVSAERRSQLRSIPSHPAGPDRTTAPTLWP